MTQDENTITSALDVVKNYIAEADANYQKNKDLHIKLEAQVSDLKADLDKLVKQKLAAHKELETIATDLTDREAQFEQKRQAFEQSLTEAKQLRDDLQVREKVAADKLTEANTKLASAETLMKSLKQKEYQLLDLEGVIASRR